MTVISTVIKPPVARRPSNQVTTQHPRRSAHVTKDEAEEGEAEPPLPRSTMRATNYQRLSVAPEPEGGARAGAARAWEALRRAAAGVARLYAARRQEGGVAVAGEGGGGEVRVRLGQLRAQLRRRGVDGRRGRVLARAVVRRVQTRRCAVIHDRASLPIPSCFVRTRD